MRLLKAWASLAAILVLLAASEPADAGRGRGHYGHHGHYAHRHSGLRPGIVIGAPAFWYRRYPGFYYYPPVYYSPVVALPVPPAFYERGDARAAPEIENYWYYCPDAKAYYPYVKECPGGWLRVVPEQSPP